MSSINEHLVPPPPKPRLSPLDFRNTDLVSRLLAATPPYLYNMSLLPNTYFFSEMLRSLVQAKTADHRPLPGSMQPRRTCRKRSWTSSMTKTEGGHKPPPPPPPPLVNNNEWLVQKSAADAPLELTTNTKMTGDGDSKLERKIIDFTIPDQKLETKNSPQNIQEVTNPSTLILPPPPPIWYPPLYPYGIDPLHFFIDLRVSGHIYDRKNEEKTAVVEKPQEIAETPILKDPLFHHANNKQTRHSSAFSVPSTHLPKTSTMLTHHEDESAFSQTKNSKFDIKSMVGFEKVCNKTGTNYIMSNIEQIYKGVLETTSHQDGDDVVKVEESEEEKEKRDLRALIGLELVVDYMNHAKPGLPRMPDETNSLTDEIESSSVDSPTLEVVALHDDT